MNNKAIKSIQERFSVLINQPLQHISRGGGSIFVEFGDLIEKNSLYRTDDGKATIKKELAGKYALHVECNSRFVLGNKVILGKYDLYKPTSEKAKTPDFDWDSFDWDI
ncbi:MAG: hypothetical protein RSC29_05170, partial [Oscillospiraceae bacterium]